MGGVILTTKWVSGGGSIDLYDPITATAETFEASAEEVNPLDLAEALREWIADPSRGWASEVSEVTLTVGDDRVRHRFEYSWTGSLVFSSVDPEIAEVLGDLTASPATAIPSSCAGRAVTSGWQRRDSEEGVRVREGSYRVGHALHSLREPDCVLHLTLAQTMALAQAQLLCPQPRTGYVWDESAQTWRWCGIGVIAPEHPGDVTRALVRLEVVGVAGAYD